MNSHHNLIFRGLAERFIASVLKTEVVKATTGSNPVPSIFLSHNSMAEWLTLNEQVAGSSPAGTIFTEE